jgi:Family of unknown function (DUF5683)
MGLLSLVMMIPAVYAQDEEDESLPKKEQNKDKEKSKEEFNGHSISKAALYSAVLPGLGQAYNRKYWKIPIIYAGFGVITYFVISNNNSYKQYNEAYIYQANGETYPTDNPYVGRYSLTQLQDAMDYYRRNRDLSYIIGGLWYVANILEAYVDAHFFEYDISEDLTMRVSPTVSPLPAGKMQSAPGIRVSFKF